MKLQKALSLLILFTFSLQSSLFAVGVPDITAGFIAEKLQNWRDYSANKPFAVSPQKSEDAMRMRQRILRKDSRNNWQERDINALYTGERFYSNLFDLETIKVIKSDDKKSFFIEQWGLTAPEARHEFFLEPEDGEIEEIVYDKEFLRLITTNGKLFSIYMPFARAGLFNHAVPLVLNMALPPEVNDSQKTNLFLVSRARKPPEFKAFSSHFFSPDNNRDQKREENNFAPKYKLEAGDQLLISEDGTLLGHFNVELLKAQYLFALEILGIGAKNGIYPRLTPEQSVIEGVAEALKKDLQEPATRDIFLAAEWAPTYERIAQKADEVLAHLNATQPKSGLQAWARSFAEPKEKRQFAEPRIPELEAGIANGDLRNFWQYVLERPEKNENLINWVFEGNRKYRIAAAAAATTGLIAFTTATSSYRGWGPEWMRPISDALSLFIPDVVLMNPPNWAHSFDYSNYLIPASAFLFMASVPLMQTIGATTAHIMGGRHKGVDFKLGLGTASMRGYAQITPGWHLGLARLTKRWPSFFSPIAAGFSPRKIITPDSPIGKRLGLNHEIPLGYLNEPVLTSEGRAKAISLRNRAIGELILNRERGIALAMLIAISEFSVEKKLSVDEIFRRIQSGEEDGHILDQELKLKISRLSAAVQSLCEKDFYFDESKNLTTEDIALVQSSLNSEIAQLESQNKIKAAIKKSNKYLMETVISRAAGWGLSAKEILGTNRMNQDIADQTWMQSRTDLVFGIFLTDFYGGRATYSNVGQLAADPEKTRFFYASGPNVSDSFEQTAIYAIASGAKNFMMWFMDNQLTESTYQPIDMVDLKIAPKTIPIREEAMAAISQLFSVPGAKSFAEDMWRGSVTQRFEFIFPSMLLGVVPRLLLAGSSVGDAFMGRACKVFSYRLASICFGGS